MTNAEPWSALGDFIRSQRQLARLSLRQLAELTSVSNPYLSQIERGLYRPSAQVLKSIAEALHLSAETIYAEAGLLDQRGDQPAASPRGGCSGRNKRIVSGIGSSHGRRPGWLPRST